MKKTLLILVLLFNVGLYSQNSSVNCGTPIPNDLVINGGFEDNNNNPPNGFGQLTNACNWDGNANQATPDYFHRFANDSCISPCISIPLNQHGGQEVNPVFGGDAYAGILFRQDLDGEIFTEIMRNELSSALQPNTEYILSFDVSLADNRSANSIVFQAFLSNVEYNASDTGELNIRRDPNGIFLENTDFSTNTEGWDRVRLSFTTGENAGQDLLYIGGISNTIFQNQDIASYYYIDNVSLTEAYNCPECNTSQISTIQNDLYNSFTENTQNCGQFSFTIPDLPECHDVVIDWGDGQTDTVSEADANTSLNHQYTTNGSFEISTTVYVDNVPCGTINNRRTVNVDCVNSNPVEYCTLSNDNYSGTLYISNVTLGSINNNSTYSFNGYQNFTSLSTELEDQNNALSVTITATANNPIIQNFRSAIYIDWNRDGDFTDSSEAITTFPSFGSPSGIPTTFYFNTPANAVPGPTRMRIFGSTNPFYGPCNLLKGEVEDYTVIIKGNSKSMSTNKNKIKNLDSEFKLAPSNLQLYPNPSKDQINLSSTNKTINSLQIFNLSGHPVITKTQLKVMEQSINVSALKKGIYYISTMFEDGSTVVKKFIRE